MAAGSDGGKYTAVMATSAAALALANLLNKPVAASGGQLNIPPELLQLFMAWAQTTDDINAEVAEILSRLPGGPGGGITVQGYPLNCDTITVSTQIVQILNTPYQLTDIAIPDGFALVVKNSPLNAAGAFIFVARGGAECLNPNLSFPLARNESVSFFVKNASRLYVSSNIVGSAVVFAVEQRS